MELRGYQNESVNGCDAAWAQGLRNLIVVQPTGGGKTRIMGHVAKRHDAVGGYGVAMAHRSVLCGQLSMALAEMGIQHDIIAQKKVVKTIVTEHMDELGRSFYNPGARWKVGSVDTMPGRAAELTPWINKVDLGFTDESHHVLRINKWGRECLRFSHPRMRWLLPTATPERPDGQGLGLDADGIAEEIIDGPSPQDLLNWGYLTPYVLRAPTPPDLDMSDVTIGSNGEYNSLQVRRAVHRSKKIIGNIVDTYRTLTPGKLGICFAVDIEHATAITKEFNAKGVPAELITADHDQDQRRNILKRYKARTTLVLVNVDLFGEGFDLPAIEVVMMARPTASYVVYAQQFGRGLRLGVSKAHIAAWEHYTIDQRHALIAASDKPVVYIHDHVDNVRHFNGPPVKARDWSLERRGRRGGPSDAIPMRICLNPICMHPYERFLPKCPRCGTVAPVPLIPTLPEQVDGDLTLYTPEMLKRMFNVDTVEQALKVQPSTFCKIPTDLASMTAARGIQATHQTKLREQQRLAHLMPLVMPPTYGEREAARKFFHQFGVDIVSARLLGAADTIALNERIQQRLTNR